MEVGGLSDKSPPLEVVVGLRGTTGPGSRADNCGHPGPRGPSSSWRPQGIVPQPSAPCPLRFLQRGQAYCPPSPACSTIVDTH